MRNRLFLALDTILAVLVAVFAFAVAGREMGGAANVTLAARAYVALGVPTKLLLFLGVGLYTRLWRYASIADLEVTLVACALGALASFAVGLGVMPMLEPALPRVPIAVLVIDSLLTGALVALSRIAPRVLRHRRAAAHAERRRAPRETPIPGGRRVLIAGAGEAGGMIVKELRENQQLGLIPVGFVDDDPLKHQHRLHGLPVFGPIVELEKLIPRLRIDEVIAAMPSAGGRVIREVMQRSSAAGARNRTVPGVYEILSGAKAVSSLRPIQIQDLLRREPIKTTPERLVPLLADKVVLVTGAGGSIGSELCRQIARLQPASIVAVGRGENSIFELIEELRVAFPNLPVRPAIVDVRDEVRLRAVFEATQPFIVFHAAAHKHVPLMEVSVDEAILNNVLGTRTVADLSAEYGVEHLVLISSDKAVRPTSIMGATKRIAEATICSVAERTGRPYVTVRFGNVLGSRGSVVPTFMRQIASGGPITITHPEMRRYFMTIPEAVQLVLQAAALGDGGEVFVLDMGEPVRIRDLAEDLIRLSGLQVGTDVEVEFTGIRPGEKLYEELFFGPENATPTPHEKILRARESRTSPEIDYQIVKLIEAARRRAPESELRRMIHTLVPEYQPPISIDGGAVAAPPLLVADAPAHIEEPMVRRSPRVNERSVRLEAS